MKICRKCNLSFNDDVNNCSQCGAPLEFVANAAPVANDPYDHTAEFTAADISGNKVVAMLPYVMGWIGIIIALLAAPTSPYAAFHVKQALKIQVCMILGVFLCIIPILGWIAYGALAIALVVVQLICFFSICSGKAKEPAIVKSLGFLR